MRDAIDWLGFKRVQEHAGELAGGAPRVRAGAPLARERRRFKPASGGDARPGDRDITAVAGGLRAGYGGSSL